LKKITYLLLIIVGLFTILEATSLKENDSKTIKITSNTKYKSIDKRITVQECKKHLGEDNYNFINELYSDDTVAISKCKNEIKK
jgi:hypothetical protein